MKQKSSFRRLLRGLLCLSVFLISVPLSARPVRVACVGNSVTYGAGVENREQNAYPEVLGRLLGSGYEVRNFGHSGATLLSRGHRPYIQTPEYREAIAFGADIVVIHLGLNDTDPRNWPNHRDDFAADYAALIAAFREANPAAKVYICRMTPISHRHPRFKSGTREWYRQIQRAIERVAESQHTELIDLQEVLYHRPELLPDALHPNAEGARLLAERVYSAITGDFGKLRMSSLYTDHMVLQQGTNRIGGIANAGQLVTLTLEFPGEAASDKLSVATRAGNDGRWSFLLPLEPHPQSGTLTLSTPDTVAVYRDVAVGDVWMVSGQSNMSWPVSQSAEAAEAMPDTGIRLFRAGPAFADERGRLDSAELARLNRLDYIRNPRGWIPASSAESFADFSAVGYFFARTLRTRPVPGTESEPFRYPIGLVQTSLGGAPAEAFIERSLLEDDPALDDILYDWRNNDMIQEWVRSVMTGNLEGVGNPLQRHFFEPAYLYESRIAPLAQGYTAKGVLWYQGESNAHNVELHERLFPKVVESWRKALEDEALPFYFVQLSSIATRPSWPHFRDSQRRLAKSLGNVEMVVSSDYGDSLDVHPRHKRIIGERLALRAYGGEKFSGPRPVEVRVNGHKEARIRFNRPLVLHTHDDTEPLTFEIAGTDGVFRPARAVILSGDRISLTPSGTDGIRRIRYGWQPFTRANLCEAGTGLPVSTFEIPVR